MPDSQQNIQQTRQQTIATIYKATKTARLSAGLVRFYFINKEKLLLGTLQSLRDESQFHIEAAFNVSKLSLEIFDAVINLYFAPTLYVFQINCGTDK